ncbi:unnamed protein product, partial [Linum tenue]
GKDAADARASGAGFLLKIGGRTACRSPKLIPAGDSPSHSSPSFSSAAVYFLLTRLPRIFMSILPIQTQGSASSSSFESPALTSDPDYGAILSPAQLSPASHPPPSRQFRSMPHSPNSSVSGTLGLGGEEVVSGSSQEVTQPVTPIANAILSHQNVEKSGSSTSGSRAVGSRQSKGRVSGNGVPLQSERNNLSTNSQGGSSHSSGRRTQMMNANHLLNFHYDPITRSQPRMAPPRRHHQKIKPYNKDLFLQANFKFVVLDTGDSSPEALDPDKNLRWEDILCVRYSTSVPLQCPVCLEQPLCPQITSCGHIFCFPCIVRYLLMGEEVFKGDCYKRCPLCFMMVSPKDLYTLSVENVKQYSVGETIEFMLLIRQKDSFTPSQRNKQESDSTLRCNDDASDPFSKFIFTSDVELSVRKPISELDDWLARADSGLVDDLEKLPYVCAAMEQLEQRKNYWIELRACDSNTTHKQACNQKGSLIGTSAHHVVSSTRYSSTPVDVIDQANLLDSIKLDSTESHEEQDVVLSSSYGDKKSLREPPNGSRDRDKGSYNFYQAVDGQHFILHPFNMKCLLRHYGSYEMLPDRINGKILQLEPMTQTEAMRRRYRYLSHFSLTTTVQLCEIDMSEILPPDALLPFMDEIKKREQQRKQQADRERKEKIKAEAAIGAYDIPFVPRFESSSYDVSPTFSMDDFEALGNSSSMSSSPPMAGDKLLFSNVTRLGYAAGYGSPGLRIEEARAAQANNHMKEPAHEGGTRSQGTPSFANVISRERTGEAPKGNEGAGKKGKKANRVLLSTAGGRRY